MEGIGRSVPLSTYKKRNRNSGSAMPNIPMSLRSVLLLVNQMALSSLKVTLSASVTLVGWFHNNLN